MSRCALLIVCIIYVIAVSGLEDEGSREKRSPQSWPNNFYKTSQTEQNYSNGRRSWQESESKNWNTEFQDDKKNNYQNPRPPPPPPYDRGSHGDGPPPRPFPPPPYDRGPHDKGPPPYDRRPLHDRGYPPPYDHGGSPPSHYRRPPEFNGEFPSRHHGGPPPRNVGHQPRFGGPPPHGERPPPGDSRPPHRIDGPPPRNDGPPPRSGGPSPHFGGPPPRGEGFPGYDRGSPSRDYPLSYSDTKLATIKNSDSTGPEKLLILSNNFDRKESAISPPQDEKENTPPRDNIDIRSATEMKYEYDIDQRFGPTETTTNKNVLISQDSLNVQYPLFQVIPVTPES